MVIPARNVLWPGCEAVFGKAGRPRSEHESDPLSRSTQGLCRADNRRLSLRDQEGAQKTPRSLESAPEPWRMDLPMPAATTVHPRTVVEPQSAAATGASTSTVSDQATDQSKLQAEQ